MQPNFYMLLPQSSLQPFAKTYMTSFYLPETRSAEVVALLKRFPTAVLIDVNALINQIRSVVAQVSEALNWVLALVFAGGILVLLASVQSSFDQRIKEAAIIRALGASTRQIYQIVLIEFLVLALCSGFSASVISELILQLLQWQVFDLPFKIHPHYWVLAPVMAVFLWLLAAFFSVKQVVSTKPVKLLKS
jgi:putative ABC transport system permease protein